MSEISGTRCILILLLIANVVSDNCKISWIESGHEVAESNYLIKLSVVNTTGDLRSYFPNTNYDVTIVSKLRNVTFTQFYFTLSNKNKSMSYGTLELREKELSMFHNGAYCINRIIDGPVSLAKVSLKIGWQSPPVNSGCVEFKAAVKETEIRYHLMNKTVCQDPRVQLDDPGVLLKNCCACDDGKYELAFEGLWSRYTHPKHFPRREWIAVFPTIIGASHASYYNFWQSYTPASEGLKKFAMTGDSIALELELKSNKVNISTLIKFRGANFQNKTRMSFASLRVSKTKHVVSLVARIDPSPDWFVGVDSLELCQADCTWIESKIFNLYPFDAGVRNGLLYEDLDGITEPQDIIQSLNMTWPPPQNGLESPFYDATNNTHDVRPLARIHLTRLRGSERSCQQTEVTEDCATAWSQWGPCSVECGFGISKRSRSIKKSYQESNCTVPLEESRTCTATQYKCPKDVSQEDCDLTEWGEWTKCRKSCGQETIKRSRSFVWRDNQKQCEDKFGAMVLEEKTDCGNPPCPDDNFLCVDDRYNNWMEWSPCSVTFGTGFKLRFRTIKEHLKKAHLDAPDSEADYGYSGCMYEKASCEVTEMTEEEKITDNDDVDKRFEFMGPPIVKPIKKPDYCFLPKDKGSCPDGSYDNSHRYYYDDTSGKCLLFSYSGCGGNDNKFNDERACTQACIMSGRKVDCQMSKWGTWSVCKDCRDFRVREKTVLVQPENGGRMCPLYKMQREPCSRIKQCHGHES